MDAFVIWASGGVVWRQGADGGPEVLLVHRPRFDDWTLPKGKRKRGEHPIRAAVREVAEETGVRGAVGPRLPSVHYDVWTGSELTEKVVDYWAMTVDADAGLRAGPEVDDRAWLDVDAARHRVSYPHDLRVLAAFARLARPALPRPPVVLVRHATAGSRKAWRGPDGLRPLDADGLARAAALAPLLECFRPTRLISAEPLRCRQTLEPLAAATGVPIEVDAEFDESADPDRAAHRLVALATAPTVICSQGGLMGPVLARVSGDASKRPTEKGSGWALTFDGGDRLAALDKLSVDPPA